MRTFLRLIKYLLAIMDYPGNVRLYYYYSFVPEPLQAYSSYAEILSCPPDVTQSTALSTQVFLISGPFFEVPRSGGIGPPGHQAGFLARSHIARLPRQSCPIEDKGRLRDFEHPSIGDQVLRHVWPPRSPAEIQSYYLASFHAKVPRQAGIDLGHHSDAF